RGPTAGTGTGQPAAGAGAADSGTPGEPAAATAAALGAAADDRLARARRGDFPIRIGDWMSRGWATFTQAGGLFLGFSVVAWVAGWVTSTSGGLLLPILLLVIGPMVSAGFFVGALIVRRGGSLRFSDLLSPFHDFLPLLLV